MTIEIIFKSGPEHDYVKHYKLKNGDVFVEGGSFFGRWATIASQKVGDTGKVVAIEPSPYNFPILKQITGHLKNVMIINKALWNRQGIAPFIVNPLEPMRHWTGHRIPSKRRLENMVYDGKKFRVVSVQTDTMDNILSELKVSHVDLLAWDIEGSEVEALEGSHNLFANKIIQHFALCFYHLPVEVQERTVEILEKYDYTIHENYRGIIYGECR